MVGCHYQLSSDISPLRVHADWNGQSDKDIPSAPFTLSYQLSILYSVACSQLSHITTKAISRPAQPQYSNTGQAAYQLPATNYQHHQQQHQHQQQQRRQQLSTQQQLDPSHDKHDTRTHHATELLLTLTHPLTHVCRSERPTFVTGAQHSTAPYIVAPSTHPTTTTTPPTTCLSPARFSSVDRCHSPLVSPNPSCL